MVKIRGIPGYLGYAASRDGWIWSKKLSRTGRLGLNWKRLKGKDNKGYRYVTLYKDGETHDWSVHQLILLTFVGPMPDGMETRHKNGIRDDNRLENLLYGTRKKNAEDCVEHGTQPHGEGHGRSKLTEEEVKEIIRLRAEEGVWAITLAEKYNVSEGLISMILSGKAWSHLERPKEYAQRHRRSVMPNAKITEDDVREIRRLHAIGWLQKDLGEKFGLAQAMVSKVVSGKSWGHVK